MERCGSDSYSRYTFLSQPCEVCNGRTAVVYCRADLAKLCLICDYQVHSANSLSLKHRRSRICDYCKAEPASIQCLTDNLILCQDCDGEYHEKDGSASSHHSRTRVGGFTDCPPLSQLASLFGFNLNIKSFNNSCSGCCFYGEEDANLRDLVVPTDGSSVFLGSENCRKEVYEQLVEIGKKEMVGMDGNGAEFGPGTPPKGCLELRNLENLKLENVDDEEFNDLFHQQMKFTSLLALPNHVAEESDCAAYADIMWDCPPTHTKAQIWDFQRRRERDCSELGPPADGYDAKDGFMIPYYSNLNEEVSCTPGKVLDDTYMTSCSATYEDVLSRNSRSNQQWLNCTPATEESNTKPLMAPSSQYRLLEPEACNSSRHIQVMVQNPNGMSKKVDMELYAKNRGNAMLRYKEKKKTRRYEKRIRYQSRKARADTRKRIEGRFVRATENC